KTAVRAWQPARNQARPAPSRRPPLPVGIDAHSRPQTLDLVHWVGADGKGPQIEIAGRAGRTPTGVFALGRDDADLDSDPLVLQRWNADRETIADFETGHKVFAQRKADPGVAEIDQ